VGRTGAVGVFTCDVFWLFAQAVNVSAVTRKSMTRDFIVFFIVTFLFYLAG
jgi:hypothetical protein